jgi:hypothetical protein
MNKTIYLPDDLAKRIEADEALNVSAVCQAALEDELHQREALARIGEDMERVTLTVSELYFEGGDVQDIKGKATFDANRIAERDDGNSVLYTAEGNIAVYEHDDQSLTVYPDFDEFERSRRKMSPGLVAQAAKALGENRPVHLDI